MRVLVTDRTGSQSIWSLMNSIAAALVGERHEVAFCRSDEGQADGTPPAPPGVEAIDIRIPPKLRVWDLYTQYRIFEAEFHQLVRAFRPHVVHTNFCVPGVCARVVARREGVPAIVSTQHELYASMYLHYRWGVRLTERYADAVVYVSQAVARSFGRSAAPFDRCGASLPRHAVIYNGVDASRVEAIAAAAGPVDADKIVCVGRLVPEKGQRILVEALPAILRARPSVRLVIIGGGPDEGYLRDRIARLGVSERVRLSGRMQPHEAALREMATAAAVVVPSDGSQEGFGLALVEALVMGVPVIASRIPVLEELAGPGACGVRFFAPPKDPAQLARAVLDALIRPLPSGGRQSRPAERVRKMFSAERMVADYLTLYERLLVRDPRRQAAVHGSRPGRDRHPAVSRRNGTFAEWRQCR